MIKICHKTLQSTTKHRGPLARDARFERALPSRSPPQAGYPGLILQLRGTYYCKPLSMYTKYSKLPVSTATFFSTVTK